MSIDPRLAVIDKRFKDVERVLVIASLKGGVGKTLVSVLLALKLKDLGYRVGLLDLDFTNPSCHTLLNASVEKNKPVEDKGLVPPLERGIRFMSIAHFVDNAPLALRGHHIDSVFKELLAITRWIDTDVVVVDSPPGLSDEALNVAGLIKKSEFILVTTPSKLSVLSLERALGVLKGIASVSGIVENMCKGGESQGVRRIVQKFNTRYLGWLPLIEGLDEKVESMGIEEVLRRFFEGYVQSILMSLGL
uniref:ATP-binding protein n=1 Tax=Fervidicoccus fontis TaxID=683846 RepID=A0A7J3ZLL0_9CREN